MTMNDMTFQYFIGDESEQFTFIKVPKIFFTDEYFSELSYGAKIIYGLLLDRMSLSKKNGWMDNQNRIYVIYTIDSIQEDFHVSKTVAVKFMKELEDFGLIEKKRRPNSATLLYIKNFITLKAEGDKSQIIKGSPYSKLPEVQNMEVQNVDFQKDEQIQGSLKSGLPENRLPEVQNMESNKTNINNTYIDESSSYTNQYFKEDEEIKEKEWEGLNDDDIKILVKNRIQYVKGTEFQNQEIVDQVIESLKEIFKSRKQSHLIDNNMVTMDLIKEKIWSCMNPDDFFDVVQNISANGADQIYNLTSYVIKCFYKKISRKRPKLRLSFENQNTYDFAQLEEELLSNK